MSRLLPSRQRPQLQVQPCVSVPLGPGHFPARGLRVRPRRGKAFEDAGYSRFHRLPGEREGKLGPARLRRPCACVSRVPFFFFFFKLQYQLVALLRPRLLSLVFLFFWLSVFPLTFFSLYHAPSANPPPRPLTPASPAGLSRSRLALAAARSTAAGAGGSPAPSWTPQQDCSPLLQSGIRQNPECGR